MRLKLNSVRAISVAFLAFSLSSAAMASIVIKGTRVIYPSSAKEVTVRLDNPGKSPVIIQTWIDKGDPKAAPESIHVPFSITPPIGRINSGKGQTLRIGFLGETLPSDKESLYWLNVLEVPAKSTSTTGDNYLQLTFRSRIKLFYRPDGLPGLANIAVNSLHWSSNGKVLQASNPTPYYVSLAFVEANGHKVEGEMVPPGGKQDFAISLNPGDSITGTYVNDYGAVREFKAVSH